MLSELGEEARSWLEREGVGSDRQVIGYDVDMRYYRQGYEIPVSIDPELLAGNGTTTLAERFNQLHEQLYGFRMEGTNCEIVNIRATGYGKMPQPQLAEGQPADSSDPSGAVVDEVEVYFQGGWLPTKVYNRPGLSPGHIVPGPAIVTEFDSTSVVLAGHVAEVDRYLNLIITPEVQS